MKKKNKAKPLSSKFDPQASSIGITWELVRNVESQDTH